MTKTQLLKKINEIPGDRGFWNSSTEEMFEEAATFFFSKGVDPVRIHRFLERIYNAVSEEYGN